MAASSAAMSVFSVVSVLYLLMGPVKVGAVHCICALGEAPDCTAVEEHISSAVNALFSGECLRDCSQHNCMMAWYTFTLYTETCPIPINYQTSDYPLGVTKRSYTAICMHCTTVGNPVCPPPAAPNVTSPLPTIPPPPMPTVPAAPAPPSMPPPPRTPIVVPVPVQSVPTVVPVILSVPPTPVPAVVSVPPAPVVAPPAPASAPAITVVSAPPMSLPAAVPAVVSASAPAVARVSASGPAPSLATAAPASALAQNVAGPPPGQRLLAPLKQNSKAHNVFVPKSLISFCAVFITMLMFHVY